jgi:pSer/pThr/pTyr-binding forkhead associated (FHA) protein
MPGPGAQPPAVDKTEIIPRGPKMAHYAMLVDRLSPQDKYELHKPIMTLGRIPSNDITLSNPTISRQHATIKLEGAIFRIYDLGSSNGTFVNDEQVREPIALQDGDIVRLGDTMLVFKIIPLQD